MKKMIIPERKEYKSKKGRKLYKLTSEKGFLNKVDAVKKAKKYRNDGFKARISKHENKYYIYYFN